MEIMTIVGGHTLAGRVRPAAAKNSVLPLLAATLLCGGPCTLRHVPRLRDVDTSLALLGAVGAGACRRGQDIITRPSASLNGCIPPQAAGAMRGSVFYLAPLLCRVGAVRLPLPGGCSLGPRPIDIHLAGLAAMGARVEVDADAVCLRRAGPLRGADFTLRLPSVGATLTLMMAACCAAGTTVLRGAACEPEIGDTADFLRAAGARITGDGTPVIVIRGELDGLLAGVEHTALPDRIAAATYAAAAACAGGSVTVQSCRPEHFAMFLQFLRAVGCEVRAKQTAVTVTRDPAAPLRGGQDLCTAAYPGFATDTAPLAAAVLLGAQGASRIYDALFQNRFACAAGFAAMGAQAKAEGHVLHLGGDAALHGAQITAPDLRGGAALAIAALGAQGTTYLCDAGHIRRGYADLPAELRALGAQCHFSPISQSARPPHACQL